MTSGEYARKSEREADRILSRSNPAPFVPASGFQLAIVGASALRRCTHALRQDNRRKVREVDECTCHVTEPDRDGNRDLIPDPDCPLHS